MHVVDDDPGVHDLFRRLGALHGHGVRTWTTAAAFLAAYDPNAPGCLVVHLDLPDRSGLQVLAEVAQRNPDVAVICTSGFARVSEAVSALKLGSLDFVEKPFEQHRLADAVKRAIELDQKRRKARRSQREVANRFATLTPREGEVLQLVVQGLPNKTVAAMLGVSPKTVEVHRASVMRKTGANSLAELVRLSLAGNVAGRAS